MYILLSIFLINSFTKDAVPSGELSSTIKISNETGRDKTLLIIFITFSASL